MISNQENNKKTRVYENIKICPACRTYMTYIYGEMFRCPNCGIKEKSDFGKVRDFLDIAGPQPAVVISENTGVSMQVIDKFLRQGRIEIPDGSEVYIKCQSCGVDIRYGRYCQECMIRMTKDLGKAMLQPEVGERPRIKAGKMHILGDRSNNKNGKGGNTRR